MSRLFAFIACMLHGHVWWPVRYAGWSQCLNCGLYRDTYKACCTVRGPEREEA
jgi:hypothetical protein